MDHQRINYLYNLYLDKTMSPQDLEEFRQVILDPGKEGELNQQMEAHWNRIAGETTSDVPEVKMDQVFNRIVEQTQHSVKRIKLWSRIAVAAAIAAVVSGIWLYTDHSIPGQHPQIVNQSNIGPGKVGATLTLANGKTIRLSDARDGELAVEAGVVIHKSPGGQLIYEFKGNKGQGGKLNTLATSRGETYQVRLPDGSHAWLNSASSLTYSTDLIRKGKRVVKLEGEAYFEIAKDKSHPFIVESKGQEVEVLGTHFNVNAYLDEPVVTTTLLEGSVSITAAGTKRRIKPGEQAVNTASKVIVQQADVDNVVDWKNGDFFLNHIEFKTAMRKIARWYDMDIIYEKTVPDNMESGGWIARNKPLSAVLKSIESSGLVKFKVEGRKIYVTQ